MQIPAGAVVRNLAGKTIMPGLVDIHAHTWVAWGVHRSQVSQFLAQLAFGVTTQRDPQTSSEDALTYQDLMETGQLIGPRLYSTGPGIFSADNIRSLDEARDVLKRYSDHYNTKTIKQYMVGDRKVRQWVIMAAKELGLTPTTEGGSNFTMNLTLMQDGYAGLEHTLADQSVLQGRGRARRRQQDHLHADVDRQLRWPDRAAALPDRHEHRRGAAAAPLHAARRAGQVEEHQLEPRGSVRVPAAREAAHEVG